MRLTSRNVRTVKAGEHRDEQVPGLILRVWGTSRAWALRYTYGGQRRRIRLGKLSHTDIDAARTLARALLSGLDRGENPRVALKRHDADGLTVADLCRKMLDSVTLRDATRRDWEGHLKRNIRNATIGGIPAATLTRQDIKAWGAVIAKRSGWSANRAFEVVRRAYSWGVEEEVIQASPFVAMKPPFAGETGRGRYLSESELARLVGFLASTPCGYTDAVWLLIYTAKRLSQVEGSRRKEWDLETPGKGLWVVPGDRAGSKGSPDEDAAISTQAEAVARRMFKLGGGYLLPRVRTGGKIPHGQISSAFVASLKQAVGAVRPWTLHCLRATFATHAQERFRADLSLVAACLGHIPPDVPEATRLYALSRRVDEKRELLQKWGDWIGTLAPKDVPEMVDAKAAAKFMGLTEKTLAQYRSWKRGPVARVILKKVWYVKSELQAWKAERNGPKVAQEAETRESVE